MYKTYKFRIYPNSDQLILINKTFGCMRKVYNYYLDKSIKEYKENKMSFNSFNCIKDYTSNLKYVFPYLQEIDSISIRKSIFNLEDAYKMFFNKYNEFPKFKSKYNHQSYTTNAVYGSYKDRNYCNIELNLKDKIIKLPKLKNVIIRGYRNIKEISGRIITATISKEQTGKYYVSVTTEVPNVHINKELNSIVGIDLGIKKLIITSDGREYENNKIIEKYEKRLKRCQRELSRKQKNSKNYYKCKRRLAILHTKIKNSRKYYIHKITTEIVKSHDIIVTETLKIKSMIKEKAHKFNKSIYDITLGEIIRQIKYKSEANGKKYYSINPYYPSSQECSICNKINKKMKDLSKRKYECENCGNEMDRDLNAAVNIMFKGLERYMKEC